MISKKLPPRSTTQRVVKLYTSYRRKYRSKHLQETITDHCASNTYVKHLMPEQWSVFSPFDVLILCRYAPFSYFQWIIGIVFVWWKIRDKVGVYFVFFCVTCIDCNICMICSTISVLRGIVWLIRKRKQQIVIAVHPNQRKCSSFRENHLPWITLYIA